MTARGPRVGVLDELGDVSPLVEQAARQLAGRSWVAHDHTSLGRMLEEVPLDVLVVATDALDGSTLDKITLIHEELPALRIILSTRQHPAAALASGAFEAVELLTLLARSGCNDLLPYPVESEAVVQALKRADQSAATLARWALRRTEDHPDVVGRLHAVTSARGGSGRTFFAIHLAAYLAGLPRSRVCLIDLDLPIGQAAAALGLRPPFTASDALSAGDDLEAQLPNFCVVHPNGFSVLAAPAPEDAARFSVEDAVRLVEAARRRFSHVVVDLSPATSRMAFAVLRAATDRWCLSTASLASLRTLNSVLPAFEQLDVPLSQVRVVLNKLGDRLDLRVEDIDAALPHGLTAALPWSKRLGQTTAEHRTVFEIEPNGELAVRLTALFSAFATDPKDDAAPIEPPPRRSPIRSLLRRRT